MESGQFQAKIYHNSGHTSGHIAFHFFNEKKILLVYTFHLDVEGFDGTFEEMFNSLSKFKKLPETEIYCGHEYTLQIRFLC